jgi:hypothetical protein
MPFRAIVASLQREFLMITTVRHRLEARQHAQERHVEPWLFQVRCFLFLRKPYNTSLMRCIFETLRTVFSAVGSFR